MMDCFIYPMQETYFQQPPTAYKVSERSFEVYELGEGFFCQYIYFRRSLSENMLIARPRHIHWSIYRPSFKLIAISKKSKKRIKLL